MSMGYILNDWLFIRGSKRTWQWVWHRKSNGYIFLHHYYLWIAFFFKLLTLVLCGFSAYGPSFSQKQRCSHSDRPYPDSHCKPRWHGGRVLQQPGYVSNWNSEWDGMKWCKCVFPYLASVVVFAPSPHIPHLPFLLVTPTLSAHPSKLSCSQ